MNHPGPHGDEICRNSGADSKSIESGTNMEGIPEFPVPGAPESCSAQAGDRELATQPTVPRGTLGSTHEVLVQAHPKNVRSQQLLSASRYTI